MRAPGLPEVDGKDSSSTLEFAKDGVSMDPARGIVNFFGTYLDTKWKFALQRGANGQRVMITVAPDAVATDSEMDYDLNAQKLTAVVSKVFNEMVFELDGTYLSFRDMMLTSKGKELSVMLSLSILVKKFPSPGLQF